MFGRKYERRYRFDTRDWTNLKNDFHSVSKTVALFADEDNLCRYSKWREMAKIYIESHYAKEDMLDLSFFLRRQIRGASTGKETLFSILYPVYMLVLPFIIDDELNNVIYVALDGIIKTQYKMYIVIAIAIIMLIAGIHELIVQDRDASFYEALLEIVESDLLK